MPRPKSDHYMKHIFYTRLFLFVARNACITNKSKKSDFHIATIDKL